MEALSKWLHKEIKYSASDVNKLPLNREIQSPIEVAAVATDMLMVTDSHSHCVYQVSITNNSACLPDKTEPFGLAFDGTNSYVSDSATMVG